jgi:hypothetical protein
MLNYAANETPIPGLNGLGGCRGYMVKHEPDGQKESPAAGPRNGRHRSLVNVLPKGHGSIGVLLGGQYSAVLAVTSSTNGLSDQLVNPIDQRRCAC